jgi:hypothetical protein
MYKKMMTSDYKKKAKALSWDMERIRWGGTITMPEDFVVPAYEFVPWVTREEFLKLAGKVKYGY